MGKIERVDEEASIADLPTSTAAHEASKLGFDPLPSPRRLLLESTEGGEVALGVQDFLDGGSTKSPDQLILQVHDAQVESQAFQIDSRELGTRAESGSLETAPDHLFFPNVKETGQSRIHPLRAQSSQDASYRVRTPDWYDGNSLALEAATEARSKRLDRNPVADSFDENNGTRVRGGEV